MGRAILAFLAMLFACFAAAPAAAQIDSAPKVQARLIAEQGEIAPGGTVAVALEEVIRPGWHTYWVNPGDAGAPTTLSWALPPGWKAGAIQWPYPKRLPVGPLMDYGYEGTVWLLTTVTAPADAKPGDVVTLKAHGKLAGLQGSLHPGGGRLSACRSPSAPSRRRPMPPSPNNSPPRAPSCPRHRPGRCVSRKADTLDLFVAAPQLVAARPEGRAILSRCSRA